MIRLRNVMPSNLATVINEWIPTIPNESNRKIVYGFVDYMKSTDTSEKYQRVNLIVVVLYAKFLGDKDLSKIDKKEDIIRFLDSRKKNGAIDPDKRWIRTWNDYLQRIKYFMRWLHNDASVQVMDWQTPPFAHIKKKGTHRLSPYVESELWERSDLLRILQYETRRRNKAALTLLWDLDARNHEVTLLKIKHVRLGERYGEAEIPHESKTGSGPALLMCSFPYVRDWLNEHPFRNEPNAKVICNLITGGALNADALTSIMKQLRKRIIGLLNNETGSISNEQERQELEHLIRTKKWSAYCIRHSAITSDSDYLPEFALKKKVRWCMNSKQPSRYIKARMGNDLKQKILVQNGIITEVDAKPAPTVADCMRCRLVNPLENKYCSSCGYPLSVSAYEELKAAETEELNQIKTELEKVRAESRNVTEAMDYLRTQVLEQGYQIAGLNAEKLARGESIIDTMMTPTAQRLIHSRSIAATATAAKDKKK